MKKEQTILLATQTITKKPMHFYNKMALIATIALCSIPTIESSFFTKGAGKAFQALCNNKLNTLCIGGVVHQVFAENANELKISALQEAHNNSSMLIQNISQAQMNAVSKTTFWTVATMLGVGCYMAIRTAYNNMLLLRPKIETVIDSAKNTQEAIHELKKYAYKKQNLKPIKATLLKKFTEAEFAIIEAQLS